VIAEAIGAPAAQEDGDTVRAECPACAAPIVALRPGVERAGFVAAGSTVQCTYCGQLVELELPEPEEKS
jgi:hypothetical protein